MCFLCKAILDLSSKGNARVEVGIPVVGSRGHIADRPLELFAVNKAVVVDVEQSEGSGKGCVVGVVAIRVVAVDVFYTNK